MITLILVLLACSDKTTDDSDTDDTGTDDSGTTDDGCPALTSGEWSATGDAFGMTMSVTLTMDADACTITFSDWAGGMDHPTPDGGTLDGDQVTFTGDEWGGCVGTASDAETITGTCAAVGGDFEFTYTG